MNIKSFAAISLIALAAFWLGGSLSNAQPPRIDLNDYPKIPNSFEGTYALSFTPALGATITIVDPELQQLDSQLFLVGKVSPDLGLLRSSEYSGQEAYIPLRTVLAILKVKEE